MYFSCTFLITAVQNTEQVAFIWSNNVQYGKHLLQTKCWCSQQQPNFRHTPTPYCYQWLCIEPLKTFTALVKIFQKGKCIKKKKKGPQVET